MKVLVLLVLALALACVHADDVCRVFKGNRLQAYHDRIDGKPNRKTGRMDFPCKYPLVRQKCGKYFVKITPSMKYDHPHYVVDATWISVSDGVNKWRGRTSWDLTSRYLLPEKYSKKQQLLMPVKNVPGESEIPLSNFDDLLDFEPLSGQRRFIATAKDNSFIIDFSMYETKSQSIHWNWNSEVIFTCKAGTEVDEEYKFSSQFCAGDRAEIEDKAEEMGFLKGTEKDEDSWESNELYNGWLEEEREDVKLQKEYLEKYYDEIIKRRSKKILKHIKQRKVEFVRREMVLQNEILDAEDKTKADKILKNIMDDLKDYKQKGDTSSRNNAMKKTKGLIKIHVDKSVERMNKINDDLKDATSERTKKRFVRIARHKVYYLAVFTNQKVDQSPNPTCAAVRDTMNNACTEPVQRRNVINRCFKILYDRRYRRCIHNYGISIKYEPKDDYIMSIYQECSNWMCDTATMNDRFVKLDDIMADCLTDGLSTKDKKKSERKNKKDKRNRKGKKSGGEKDPKETCVTKLQKAVKKCQKLKVLPESLAEVLPAVLPTVPDLPNLVSEIGGAGGIVKDALDENR